MSIRTDMAEHRERIKKERKSFKVNFILELIDGLDEEQWKDFMLKLSERGE